MPPKIYIDGQAGTTALRIREWLADRNDLEVVVLPEELRKDPVARKQALRDAAIVLLCLPDAASQEAANWLADTSVRILDASTAHRVAEGWVYGLPELVAGQRKQITKAPRVANPGCYSSAVILLLRPLIDADLIAPDTPLAIHALSGYSGGGRSMIERWEDPKLRIAQAASRGAVQHWQISQAHPGDHAPRTAQRRAAVFAQRRTISLRHAR